MKIIYIKQFYFKHYIKIKKEGGKKQYFDNKLFKKGE